MKQIEGRVAVVTGAASGIGRGMVEAFAGAGMKVVLADVRADALAETTEAIRATGAEAESVVTDVRDAEQVEALAKRTVEAFGAAHVLCNNAGVATSSPLIWEASLEEWRWQLDVMVMGVVHGLRSFMPILLEQDEGHVVNTASMGGLITGSDSQALYMTAKHGVVAMTEGLQHQLEGVTDKVKCSVLCPAFVVSDVFRNFEALCPEAVPSARATPEKAQALDGMQSLLDLGMPARDAGEIVLAAIREERFYVLTHPEWVSMVEGRMRAIVDGEHPARPVPPL